MHFTHMIEKVLTRFLNFPKKFRYFEVRIAATRALDNVMAPRDLFKKEIVCQLS